MDDVKIFIVKWQNKYGYDEYELFSEYKPAKEYQKLISKKIAKQRTNNVMLTSRTVNSKCKQKENDNE